MNVLRLYLFEVHARVLKPSLVAAKGLIGVWHGFIIFHPGSVPDMGEDRI